MGNWYLYGTSEGHHPRLIGDAHDRPSGGSELPGGPVGPYLLEKGDRTVRTPITSFTIPISAALVAACTGVPQPHSYGDTDTSSSDSDIDADTDTGPAPTMTSMPDWKLTWAVRAGGDEHDQPDSGNMFRETGVAIAPLANGSVYLAGQVAEAAVFGEGEPNETTFPDVYVSWSDAFLARYGESGKLAWVRRIGGNGDDHAFDVAALDDGSAVVVGRFDSSDLVLGAGEPNETVFHAVGGFHAYAARYAPDGALAWAVPFAESEDVDTMSYAFDVFDLADGSLLVAGTFTGTLWPGGATEIASLPSDTSGPSWDGYLAWLDADTGAVVRAQRIGEDAQFSNKNVAILADGSVVVAAEYFGDETFGVGEPNEKTLHCGTTESGREIHCVALARYGAEGKLQWVKDLGLVWALSTSIALLDDGDVGLFSTFGGPSDPDGDGTAFVPEEDEAGVVIAKYGAADGALRWARLGFGSNYCGLSHVFAVPGGGLVAEFSFDRSLLEFEGDDPGQVALVPAGQHDIAVVRFFSDGEIEWMHRLGGEGYDYILGGAQRDGTTMWLTGAYGSDPFIATSGNGDDVSLPLSGYTDVFLMRFDTTAPPAD